MQIRLHELALMEPELLFWGPGAEGSFVIDLFDWFNPPDRLNLSQHTSREEAIASCLSRNLTTYSLVFDAVVSMRTDESAWFLVESFGGPTEQGWDRVNCVLWKAHNPSRLADFVFRGLGEPAKSDDLKHYQVRLGHDIFDVLTGTEPKLLSTAE